MAQQGNSQGVVDATENRGRLLNIIQHISREIESSIDKQVVQQIMEMDQKILEYLDREKQQLKQEISAIYKNRIAHGKYKLSI